MADDRGQRGWHITRGVIVLAAITALTSCATGRLPKLPVCDGNPKHRRDANPYGTVLPGAPEPAPAPNAKLIDPPAGSYVPPPPPPPPASPADESSALPPASAYASC